MSFFAKPPKHRAYLLRIWEERVHQPGQAPEWRFSLEDAESGRRRGFARLASLVHFLEAELAQSGTEPMRAGSEQNAISRLVQSVKDTFRPLADSELDVAAAAGSDQPDPTDKPPDEEDPSPH